MLHEFNYWLWAALLVAGCALGWATNLVTLPGNWIVVGLTAVFAYFFPPSSGHGVSWTIVFVLAALAAAGEVLEFAASAATAARHGGSRRGMALALFGALVGSVLGVGLGSPIPVLGSLIGAVAGGALGAFGGAYLGETWKGRPEDERVAVGKAAFWGRLWGTAGKLTVGAVMVLIATLAALL
jgi:uncharacterized protein YqgC (DUF456 family)